MTCSLFCSFAPALGLLVTGLFAAPQDETSANRETFDVISIKPIEDCPRTNSAITPGRLQFDCVSVRGLIRTAYGAVNGMAFAARDIRVVGGPSWLDTDVYNIAAKTDTRVTTADIMGPMLRSLLEDRFQLKVHKEPRETSVYELAISGAKLNLQSIKDGDCTPIDLTNLTLAPHRSGETMPKYCGGSRGKPNSCYDLGYESQNKDARMRAISKSQRIRRRLGGSPSVHEPFPEKPPKMWERTYNRLRDQAIGAENKYCALTERR